MKESVKSPLPFRGQDYSKIVAEDHIVNDVNNSNISTGAPIYVSKNSIKNNNPKNAQKFSQIQVLGQILEKSNEHTIE